MPSEFFAIASTVIASIGTMQYLWLTATGKVQPNRVTFFFWGLFPLIAYFAQTSVEVSSVAWITLAVGLLPFAVVAVSYLNPAAYWRIERRDYVLALIAVIAMLLWYVTSDPILALLFALLADVFAGVPTLIKSYTAPHSEDWRPYALNCVGFFVGLFAVENWVFAEYSFVLYLFLMTLVFTLVIYVRQKQVGDIALIK